MVYIYQYFPGTVAQCTLLAAVRDTLYSSQYTTFLADFLGVFRGFLTAIIWTLAAWLKLKLCKSEVSASKFSLKQAEGRRINTKQTYLEEGGEYCYSNVKKSKIF